MSAFPVRMVLVLAVLYGLLCFAVFLVQRRMIYYPTPEPASPSFPVLTLDVPGASLRISARPMEGPHALVYFGGNAEDVSMTIREFAAAFPGRAVYMPHYRGYGGSSGRPSEAALHSDAREVLDWVISMHPEVAVIGRSLGSAVAVRLAAEAPVEKLVLVTPFDSMLRMARHSFPLLPVDLLLLDRYESTGAGAKVTAPTLIIAADRDEVVPMERTFLLREAFADGVAEMLVIRGAGHNTLSGFPEYMNAVVDWIGR